MNSNLIKQSSNYRIKLYAFYLTRNISERYLKKKPNLFRTTAIGIRDTDFATRSGWKTSRRFGKGKTAGTSQGLPSPTMRFHTFWDRTRRNATRGIDSYINTGSRYGKYGSGSRTKIWQWHSIVVDNVWLLDHTISLVITWRLLAPPKVGSGTTGACFRSLGDSLAPQYYTEADYCSVLKVLWVSLYISLLTSYMYM